MTFSGFIFLKGQTTMYIQEVTNEKGATVYHVEDGGCIQEFWTREQAQEYVDYVNELFTHWSEAQ